MKYLIIPFIWIAYCALHSFLISITFTNKIARVLKNHYAFYRLFYVLLSLVLLIWVMRITDQADNEIIITYSPALSAIRYILIAGSLILFTWAFFFSYDPLSFFGIRQILHLVKPEKPNSSAGISRKGVLGVVRHPMYLALIIFLLCLNFTVMDIIVNSILIVYVLIGTILEEKKLVLEFGAEYENYKNEVPMLIPFTKKKHVINIKLGIK